MTPSEVVSQLIVAARCQAKADKTALFEYFGQSLKNSAEDR